MNGKTSVYAHRDVVMIVLVAAIFVLAVVYSVYSATTIGANVNTGGTLTASGVSTLSGAVYASSTMQATGNAILYGSLSVGATTTSSTRLGVETGASVLGGPVTIFGELKVPYLKATTTTSSFVFGNFGYATETPGTALSIQTGASVLGGPVTVFGQLRVPYLQATTTTSSFITGNLGVGTDTPGTLLAVDGPALVKGTTTAMGGIITPSINSTSTLGIYAATTTATGGATFAGTSGSFGVGTTSPMGKVGFTGSPVIHSSGGTTTLSLDTAGTTQGGCLELKGGTNQGLGSRWIRIYVGGTAGTNTLAAIPPLVLSSGGANLLVIEEGRCQ